MSMNSCPRDLKLTESSRDALERQAVRIAAMGSNDEVRAAVERLKPKGKLTLAVRSGDAVPRSR